MQGLAFSYSATARIPRSNASVRDAPPSDPPPRLPQVPPLRPPPPRRLRALNPLPRPISTHAPLRHLPFLLHLPARLHPHARRQDTAHERRWHAESCGCEADQLGEYIGAWVWGAVECVLEESDAVAWGGDRGLAGELTGKMREGGGFVLTGVVVCCAEGV